MQKRSPSFMMLTLALLIALLSVGLVACASQPDSTQASSGSTAASPTVALVQKCGTVQTGPGMHEAPVNPDLAKKVTNCFWQAFQHCQSAIMIYSSSGVDTRTVRTFTIQNSNDHCSISDVAQHYIVPNQNPTSTQSFTCTGVSQQAKGLQFSACGDDGDVLVPTS